MARDHRQPLQHLYSTENLAPVNDIFNTCVVLEVNLLVLTKDGLPAWRNCILLHHCYVSIWRIKKNIVCTPATKARGALCKGKFDSPCMEVLPWSMPWAPSAYLSIKVVRKIDRSYASQCEMSVCITGCRGNRVGNTILLGHKLLKMA